MIKKLLKENRDQDARNRQYIEVSTEGGDRGSPRTNWTELQIGLVREWIVYGTGVLDSTAFWSFITDEFYLEMNEEENSLRYSIVNRLILPSKRFISALESHPKLSRAED